MLCGIPAIDDQHKELFRQIDALRDRGNKDRIPAVLRFLADYVVKHFNDEESIHLKSRYPHASGHRKLHVAFVDRFMELKAKYEKSGGDFSTVMEINKVVYDWLKEHVLKVDKEFAKYYLNLPENQ
jgi:hemerythrin